MRTLLLATMALALTMQDPLPPGNPDHKVPDEGWFCYTDSPVAPAPEGHACICHEHRTCVIDQGTGERVVQEHPTCRVWCFKDSCRCALHCPDTH